MKTFKSYIIGLGAFVAAAMGLSACQDDVKAPGFDIPQAKKEATISILDLKTEFWSNATNYASVIEDKEDPSRQFIIKGRVISSDYGGNIFKSIVIADETAAIAFSVDTYNLYLNYRVGQEIVVDLTGREIGKYAGLQQIGRKSWYENGNTDQVSFMSAEAFKSMIELNGLPEPAKVDTIEMNSFAEISQQTDETLRKYQSQLVRFNRVHFPDGGKRPFSVFHTSENDDQNNTLMDASGATLTVRTSGYANFFNEMLPVGDIDIVGILSYYNDSWQLMMMDIDGIIRDERPGTKDNPCTVAQAIEYQAAGYTSKVWVKGYIVGAAAPGVTTVASNEDIEWEAPTVLAETLIIAPSATTQDYTQCLAVWLPTGSPLREYGNLRDNATNIGKEILIEGVPAQYIGMAGLTGNDGAASEFEIEGVTVSGGEVTDGDGTEANPYNVAAAYSILESNSQTEEEVYVKGIISSIREVDTGTYGNATYNIVDQKGGREFLIYRGYYLNGDKFTAANQIEVDGTVIIKGKLINYTSQYGTTPEMAQGNQIVSYTAPGGTTPVDPNPGPVDPTPVEGGVLVQGNSLAAGTNTVGDYTITIEKASGATAPSVPAAADCIRLYADNTITVSGPNIERLVFAIAKSNSFRYTTLTPNVGEISPAQATGDTQVTWINTTGATSVTFTIGHDATLGSHGASKRGQIHMASLTIVPKE